MRVYITTPLWTGTRTGTARPAFGKGRYHVTLDGETERRIEHELFYRPGMLDGYLTRERQRELLFTASELAREDGGRL